MSDKAKFIVVFVVLASLVAALGLQDRRMRALTHERDKYQRNTEALLTDVETFKVRDSLNAAKVMGLELSLKEFERYRAEDAALIKQLKAKNRDLQAISATQTQTIMELSAAPKDTVVIRDSVKIPALLLHCGDAWYDFDGLLANNEFTGTMVSRDSLLVSESVRYKRFLGFLWKTKRIKDREMGVLSRNPHTTIQGCEFITIERD